MIEIASATTEHNFLVAIALLLAIGNICGKLGTIGIQKGASNLDDIYLFLYATASWLALIYGSAWLFAKVIGFFKCIFY